MYNPKNNTLKLILIYIYAFYVIYMPELKSFIGLRSHLILVILLLIMIIPFLLSKRDVMIVKNKHIFYLCLGIVISSVYYACRAAIVGSDLRLIQNNYIIVQILHVIIIINMIKRVGYGKEYAIRLLMNLGVIQGLICIGMVLFPSFRDIALNLYYNGENENVFISASRIYGISSDYTFFTPVFHGLLAVVAFIFAVFKSYKYLYYIPFILISILLNGRIGLIIFVFGTFIGFTLIILKGKKLLKIIQYTFLFITIITFSLYFIKMVAPGTYSWIESGFEDTVLLFSTKELEGNYVSLFGTMLYWPEGISLLWGEGHRVYGEHGATRGFYPSDIGYVNDMFMGGIIYISLLYISVFKFLLVKIRDNDNTFNVINDVLSIVLVFIMLLSNYKGESLKAGTILLGAMFIKLILMEEEHKILDKG
ncbi:MAG: hypothetical protein ACQEXQ_20035 [Bacillota bacterium]